MGENKKASESETDYLLERATELPYATREELSGPQVENNYKAAELYLESEYCANEQQDYPQEGYGEGSASPGPEINRKISGMAIASLAIAVVGILGNIVISSGFLGIVIEKISEKNEELIMLVTIIMANVGVVLGIIARNKGENTASRVVALLGIILNETLMLFLVYMMAVMISCLRAPSCQFF